ncbi:MAG: sugar transferase [Bacteroidota bacterium]
MKRRPRLYLIIIDIFILLSSFTLSILLKKGATLSSYYQDQYLIFYGVLLLLWLIISFTKGKFNTKKKTSLQVFLHIIKLNAVILGFAALLMYSFRLLEYSRFIVLGTIIIATIFEYLLAYIQYLLQHTKLGEHETKPHKHYGISHRKKQKSSSELPALGVKDKKIIPSSHIVDTIKAEAGEDVYHFLNEHLNLNTPDYIILATTTRFNIDRLPDNYYKHIINLKRVNDIRYVNKFFESINAKIPYNGIFVGCVETKNERKKRLLKKYPPGLNIIYYSLDFIVKRIFPKFSISKQIYFLMTRGENRVISEAEILGRLYSCGFELILKKEITGHLFFVAKKTGEPAFDETPTYGPFIKLPRIGKNGKLIYVFKLRTMHPYAEYIQDYVYKTNALQEGGKFSNDFRVTTLGKFFRKTWLDEFPMIINLLKGEMKIIGVRPLSQHYFNLYSEELQKKRVQYKPGLIPPFYADLPETLEDIQNSELNYLNQYDRHPFKTDTRYLFKAIYNIVFKKKRSC